MGKRKRNRDDNELEHLRKKYRRLKKRARERKESSSSSSDDDRYQSADSDLQITEIPDELIEETEQEQVLEPDQNQEQVLEQDQNQEQGAEKEGADTLDPDILQMLGEDPETNNKQGKDFHNKVATQWQHFLLKGLPKEEKTALLNEYLPPPNCQALIPPKLNMEVQSALSEAERKKDVYNTSKQTQLSSCLAAIGGVLSNAMTHKDKSVRELVKPLSNAGRLLCDVYHRETLTRRFTIINSLNHKLRDTIKKTSADEFLFGSALNKHLETSKAISKSGYELKQNRGFAPSQVRTQAQVHAQPRNTLNARGMPQPSTSDGRMNPSYPSYWRPPPPLQAQRLPPPQPPPMSSARGRRPQPSNSSRSRHTHNRYRDRRY